MIDASLAKTTRSQGSDSVSSLSEAVFDLPGGLGFNPPPLHEDDLPTGTCLGSALTPRMVPGATGQNVGYKKVFCSQIICVPTFKFVTPPLFFLLYQLS